MSDAYLVSAVRTPVGRYGGVLSGVRPDDLAALVVREAVNRSGVPDDVIDEVIMGAANQAGEDNRNVARMTVLLAGLPDHVPGVTVNRLCASGLTAVTMAAQAIRSGDADVIVAGGVESMSRAPWVQAKPERAFAKPGAQFDTSIGWRFVNPLIEARDKATFSMPETAEEVARVYGVSRHDADVFALRSHRLAVDAIDGGRFADEIVAVPTRSGPVTVDEGPRRDTTLDALARLRPVVSGGSVVTAGNASSLNDGASALVVASAEAVARYGLRPLARVVAGASVGVAPEVMGMGPVPATRKVLQRAGLDIQDLGAIELNEAFATQSLAVMRELELDEALVNADGGAIALGHPLGSSGSRLVVTLIGRMEREQARFGLATMCVGVGQGTALIVERMHAAAGMQDGEAA
jgi:acetyl-CoA C-acetyltransferase